MKTLAHNTLHDATKTETATPGGGAETTAADTSVSAGLVEILSMRVGCWQAPVHLTTVPSAA